MRSFERDLQLVPGGNCSPARALSRRGRMNRLSSLLSADELTRLVPERHGTHLHASGTGRRQAFRFEIVSTPAALADHAAAWDELALHAIEPNVFHERWMLLPAMHAYGQQADLAVVLAYA